MDRSTIISYSGTVDGCLALINVVFHQSCLTSFQAKSGNRIHTNQRHVTALLQQNVYMCLYFKMHHDLDEAVGRNECIPKVALLLLLLNCNHTRLGIDALRVY